MERFECYHGTSQEYGARILKEKHFNASSEDDDWAGSGIYYFIDSSAQGNAIAYKNAKYWAKFKQHFNPQVILKSIVIVDESKLLDLRDEYYQGEFHRYRIELFREALAKARKQGVTLKEKYLVSGKLDCVTINEMCVSGDFGAVIKQAYIAYLSYPNWINDEYPRSFTPNCTIFCLRDNSMIRNTVRALKT